MLEKKSVEERVESLEKLVMENIEFIGEKGKKAKDINRGIKDHGYSRSHENAILRKAIAYIVSNFHLENDPHLREFIAYNNEVEYVKAKIKAEHK